MDLAQSLGLNVFENVPLVGNVRGMIYIRTIALSDKLKTEDDKRVVLAEEITHYQKNTGNITDLNIHIHEELIAHKAMIEQIDLFEVLDAIIENGEYANSYNTSKTLGLPEWFFKELYQFYSKLPVKPFIYRHCRVYFNPLRLEPIEEEYYEAQTPA